MRKLLAAFALFVASPALALDAPGLTAEVEDLLLELKIAAQPGQLQWNPVEVVPAGETLRVHLSGLRVDGIEGPIDLEIGNVDLRVREGGPGLFIIDEVDLPPRVYLRKDGIVAGSFALQPERFAATYSATLGIVTQLDVVLRQIDLRPTGGTWIVADRLVAFMETLPEVNAYGATGFDSQRLLLELGNFAARRPGKAFELDSLAIEANLQGIDWLAFPALWNILGEQQALVALGDRARLAGLRTAWLDADPMVRSYDLALRLDGLRALGEGRRTLFNLDHLESVGAQEPADRDGLFSTGGTFNGDGFAIGLGLAPDVGPYLPLVPTRWSSYSHTDGIPTGAWAGVLFDLVAAVSSKDEDALAALLVSSQSFDAALAEAGTQILLRELTIETPLLRLENKASLRYATSTPLTVVGTWVSTLSGLDEALQWSQGLTDEEAKRGASAVLLAIRGFGQSVAQADASAIYRYTFVLPPDGNATLNGLPLANLLQNKLPQ